MGTAFEGSSTALAYTKIAPTLDVPIEDGYSSIWCASFLSVWKEIADEITSGDILLESSPETASYLNSAADPRGDVPDGSMFIDAGLIQYGIEERIREGLAALFPSRTPPALSGLTRDSLVAYSYLEANVQFCIPFFQSRKPLLFKDSCGADTQVTAFGIRTEDEYAYYQLRKQPLVLFRDGDPTDPDLEFALDLCSESSPSQIIVARISREPTLGKALKRLQKEEKKLLKLKEENPEYADYLGRIGPNDVLLVPDLSWDILHRYSELEGRQFKNKGAKGFQLDLAQQDIRFKLDRSGAELESESKVVCLPVPTFFVLDRPFLILMRERGKELPYFAMWIDNSELLTPW